MVCAGDYKAKVNMLIGGKYSSPKEKNAALKAIYMLLFCKEGLKKKKHVFRLKDWLMFSNKVCH